MWNGIEKCEKKWTTIWVATGGCLQSLLDTLLGGILGTREILGTQYLGNSGEILGTQYLIIWFPWPFGPGFTLPEETPERLFKL